MRTFYLFKSETDPELRAYTDSPSGSRLPAESGPWALLRSVSQDVPWPEIVARAIIEAGVSENGFLLWSEPKQEASSKPIIESDRVEGTTVFDPQSRQIGTIKRLLIEKVSGQVLYVDLVFGGFLGFGANHFTIPWGKLTYDTRLGGYKTDVTEEQVRGAPVLYGDDQVWPHRHQERDFDEYWRTPSR